MREEWDFNNPAINEEPTDTVAKDGAVSDNICVDAGESLQEDVSAAKNEAMQNCEEQVSAVENEAMQDCEEQVSAVENGAMQDCEEQTSAYESGINQREVAAEQNGMTPDDIVYDAKEPVQKEEAVGEDATMRGKENGSYHWVNPELAKRQQGAATEEQNTYVASGFREQISQGDQQQMPEWWVQKQKESRNAQQGQNAYQSQNRYGSQGSYMNQNGGQDQYRNQDSYANQNGAQSQDQYRNQDSYANQNGAQSQNQYGNQTTYENRNWQQENRQAADAGKQGTGYHDQSYQGGWGAFTNNKPKTGERQYGSYQFAQDDAVKEQKGKEKKKKEKKPKGTGNKFLVTVGLAVVFGVVAGGVMFGVNRLANTVAGEPQQEAARVEIPAVETPEKKETTSDTVPQNAGTGQYSVAQVAANCMPSVVSITNASVTTVRDFFGGQQEYLSESSGSGIIVGQNDKELLIATNNHVVDGASTITVAFTDEAVCEAQVKGTDSDNDLAVIAVMLSDMTEETQSAIRIATIGDSDSLQVGEQVVAIGNALGYGQSVTSGWVSALDREMLDTNGISTGKLIQTDAAINPGNSGGALLNMNGELIGINSAKAAATEVEGMGYAIPISVAEPILDELMNRETRYIVDDEEKTSYIGVTCLSVDSASAQMYGIPTGAFVDSVEEGGPAAKAGIIKGDVITKFDGLTIESSTELVEKLQYYEAGETVEVVIYRAESGEYKEHVLSVTLGKRSEMKQQ